MKFTIDLQPFYSKGDENRFFQGLKENRAVLSFRGVGSQLILDVSLKLLGRDSLWEIIALLWRYGVPLAPLAPLSEKPRFGWLNQHHFFWHSDMFRAETA